jgi:uncharacterized integral membrane protein
MTIPPAQGRGSHDPATAGTAEPPGPLPADPLPADRMPVEPGRTESGRTPARGRASDPTPPGDAAADGVVGTPPPVGADRVPEAGSAVTTASESAGRPAPPLRRSRTGGIWVAAIVAAVVLLFLLIFILQNLTTVTVHLLGFSWSMPLGVAMLFAALAGVTLLAMIGTTRILQLRRFARRAAAAGRDYRAAVSATSAPSEREARNHRQP